MALYTLPELPYDLAALEPHYSARALELHHAKHHQAYVDGANETIDKLAAARDDDDFSALGALEKSLAFHVSGHLLHSVFWPSLSADGGGSPEGELGGAIDETFGSVERLKAQLSSATIGLQGSGWGALHWEPMAERLIVTQVYDHQSNVAQGSLPLPRRDGGSVYVTTEVQNQGTETAQDVQVVAELVEDGESVQTGEQVIHFLAGEASEELVFVFDTQSDLTHLTLRVESYAIP